MLDPHIPLIEQWLAATPQMPAVEILARLETHVPGQFGPTQLRTVQRLAKKWRAKAARHLIAGTEAVIRIEPKSADAFARPAMQLKVPHVEMVQPEA
jgi:hypothetical protein